jgi:hypothetical protein
MSRHFTYMLRMTIATVALAATAGSAWSTLPYKQVVLADEGSYTCPSAQVPSDCTSYGCWEPIGQKQRCALAHNGPGTCPVVECVSFGEIQ